MAEHRPVNLHEVLFEFQRRGRVVRVVAIDPVTNTEVTMVGDPRAGQETLKRLAVRKLQYVIDKNRNDPKSNRGIVV